MLVKTTIKPLEKDLGGFSVRRLLPNPEIRMVGPWIFFDHMGPANFPAGKGIDVRPHPHINLATVTYLFAGEVLHRDSLGNKQKIKPGDINLMVAGKGITHSEREADSVRNKSHTQHGLQLWHALPEEFEEIDPAFYHYDAEEMPPMKVGNAEVRVMMGSAYNFTSPVKTFTETIYLEAKLDKGDDLRLPDAEEIAVYVVLGEIKIGDKTIPEHHLAVLEKHQVTITATEKSRIAIIGGHKLSPRHIEWNFVSSSKERILQAKKDWKDGKFPKVPGDEKEFIPLPE
ncbi:MAG: pirin family protein [Rickettsiales bacterium]